jgi:HSP90 family molecular chaperone
MNKTTISPDAGIETIYHEASHSATTWEVKKHVSMKNGRPVARTKIGEDLVAIFDAAEARSMQEGRDFGEAFKNMDEFVANAFNNAEFERFLADTPSVVETPAPLTSLWTDWLNALVDMFKIPNMDKSLLSDLVSVAPDLFVGTRPENLKNFPAVEPLYQKNANKSADQLQEETGINKLHTGSSKSIFKTIADIDIKHAIRNFTSAVFSSDSALNAAMRESMDKAGLPFSKIKEVVQSMMTSQALHAENIATYFLELGGIRYNNDSFTFEIIPSESGASWGNMMKRIGEIGKQ